MPKKSYDFNKVLSGYAECRSERSEWEAEWRSISDFLLPGRGIYQTYSKPRKRKLTSAKVVNTVAEDALYVLTSGMHGGLTSPSRPWFALEWSEKELDDIEPLKVWLQENGERLHTALQRSNFYSVINSFYIEYAGFGTGSMYVGEDSDDDTEAPFRFELLTAGEYAFSVNSFGRPAAFYRTLYRTPRRVYERWPDTCSSQIKKAVNNREANIDKNYLVILEYVCKEEYLDKPYTRVFYDITSSSGGGSANKAASGDNKPLEVSGYYEFPYPVGRWGTIGSDVYGVGPGSRALPDIKRLQEMEKAFLMATHKTINPPLNIPGRMRGKLNTLPGGENYNANPNEAITELYQVRFDYGGVSSAVERVEQRIQRNFFNDIFLTASRDPNASPLKATQVNVQEQEKMLRLGPVIERLQHEFFMPVIERCFNIMLRKGKFTPLPPEYEDMISDYNISLISPLATAQRSVALQGINSFMAFVAQAAQFDQKILDNIDVDEAAREMANINGVKLGVLRPKEVVEGMRQQRAEAQQKEQQKQEQMAAAQMGSQMNAEVATAQKTQAEAGVAQLEQQQMAQDMGII